MENSRSNGWVQILWEAAESIEVMEANTISFGSKVRSRAKEANTMYQSQRQ